MLSPRPGQAGTMRRAALALLAALGCTLAACGGGGSDPPSRGDYAAQANKVCDDLERKVDAITADVPTTTQDLVGYADRIRAALDDGVARLKDVERPDGDDGRKASAYVERLESVVDEQVKPALEEVKRAARAGDVRGVQRAGARIQELDSAELKRLARDAGLDHCAG
jgi:hypothetical protein